MDFLINRTPGERRYKFLGFGGGSPAPIAVPDPPEFDDPEVKRKAELERLARGRRRGLAGTILTRPSQKLGDVQPNIQRTKAGSTLGAGRVAVG